MSGLFLCILLGAASAPAGERPINLEMIEPWRVSWDANIEGGLGAAFPPARLMYFGRARAGVLIYRYPFYVALGPTFEVSPVALASFGAQAELLHLGYGLWAQAGGSLSTALQPGAMIAGGFSVVGVEGQYRTGADWAVLGKIRIPISLLVMAMK